MICGELPLANGKRRTELANMQDRLLNGYLAGAIEEAVFKAKTAALKREAGEVDESIENAGKFDPAAPERALALFDFSQNLADRWRRSNSVVKREILDCVSLNRAVSDVTLCVEKRWPFEFLLKRPFLKIGRSDWI
jgi:site-specific DNA recombinase